jgi:hypothetical protein
MGTPPALGQKSFRSCDKRHRLTYVSGGSLAVRGGKTSLIGHRPVNLLLHLATHGGVLFLLGREDSSLCIACEFAKTLSLGGGIRTSASGNQIRCTRCRAKRAF